LGPILSGGLSSLRVTWGNVPRWSPPIIFLVRVDGWWFHPVVNHVHDGIDVLEHLLGVNGFDRIAYPLNGKQPSVIDLGYRDALEREEGRNISTADVGQRSVETTYLWWWISHH
jgi:hypothetical protein